jgi:tetratricopeptide (TPR) repeat protein
MEPSFADFYGQSRRQRVKGWLRKHWKVCSGALGGIALVYVGAVFNEVAPAPEFARGLACQTREWWSDPAPGTHFTILISNLAGDADGRQTRLVRDAFVGQRGVDVRRTCHVVEVADGGGSLADAEAEAQKAGQALLNGWNADLLIWGEVKKADQELSLWFSSREGGSTLGSPSYSLTEKLTLPENFQADLGTQLEAVALAQIAPATEQAETFLVDILKPVRDRLEQLVTAPPPGVNAEQMASLRFSLALAAQTIGEQSGENEPLEAAVHEYRILLVIWSRDRTPLDWATAQNNLGIALETLGERGTGTVRLHEAVEAYRSALLERTREQAPLQWATTQTNLGTVLTTLAERENSTARLKEALFAFRAALGVRTRKRVPLDWATTMNNMGNTLSSLGERESDITLIEQAVHAYRVALEVQNRESEPIDWGRTNNNLGNALSKLGENQSKNEHLLAAIEAYKNTLQVWTRDRIPLHWAKAQNNLCYCLALLGNLNEDAAILTEAVDSCRLALQEYAHREAPLSQARTQDSLGFALLALGKQEAGTVHLEQAIAAYEAALVVLRSNVAKHYVNRAKKNLRYARALLAERRDKSATK